jgi:hypothetical protein
MTIFDAPPIKPPWKYRRLALAAGSGVVIAACVIFWLLRFHAEYKTVRNVMTSIADGNFQQAYQLWKPTSSYSYQDFLQDWGQDGYYGPVKSYREQRFDYGGFESVSALPARRRFCEDEQDQACAALGGVEG